ncbi:MAG: hypothetical protein EXS05_16395 [Planctomycetaceae bacterium]|nr:hypothetical protein [Planctomycetaceae bacterium]
MISRIVASVCLVPAVVWCNPLAAEELVSLRGKQVELVWAAAGGALVTYRFHDDATNPLNFEVTPDIEQRRDDVPFLRGHFLCLDRWGAPSKAEESHGVPFHGEAPRVAWKVDQPPSGSSGKISAEMSCVLPLAGMRVSRQIVLDEAGSVALVTERVTNTNHLARIYNQVQHPSIAPPFLNDGTLVDSNAGLGFVQDGPVPASRDAAGRWPRVQIGDRETDLRRFLDEAGNESQHDVSSFVFADAEIYGWVTVCSPKHKLLLGYVWRTGEYPWLNIWRYRHEGKQAARGLEFGTTGYHQPFPILVRQGQILDRRIYEPLDADETVSKSYLCFLSRIPADFQGVVSLSLDAGAIKMRERRDNNPRAIELRTGLSLPIR